MNNEKSPFGGTLSSAENKIPTQLWENRETGSNGISKIDITDYVMPKQKAETVVEEQVEAQKPQEQSGLSIDEKRALINPDNVTQLIAKADELGVGPRQLRKQLEADLASAEQPQANLAGDYVYTAGVDYQPETGSNVLSNEAHEAHNEKLSDKARRVGKKFLN